MANLARGVACFCLAFWLAACDLGQEEYVVVSPPTEPGAAGRGGKL
ncbi:MAG: hypothetical protein PVI41_06025 [Roseobacter sp.]